MVSQTRREFLKLGLAAAASAAAASGIEIPLLGNQNSNLQSRLRQRQSSRITSRLLISRRGEEGERGLPTRYPTLEQVGLTPQVGPTTLSTMASRRAHAWVQASTFSIRLI